MNESETNEGRKELETDIVVSSHRNIEI